MRCSSRAYKPPSPLGGVWFGDFYSGMIHVARLGHMGISSAQFNIVPVHLRRLSDPAAGLFSY